MKLCQLQAPVKLASVGSPAGWITTTESLLFSCFQFPWSRRVGELQTHRLGLQTLPLFGQYSYFGLNKHPSLRCKYHYGIGFAVRSFVPTYLLLISARPEDGGKSRGQGHREVWSIPCPVLPVEGGGRNQGPRHASCLLAKEHQQELDQGKGRTRE